MKTKGEAYAALLLAKDYRRYWPRIQSPAPAEVFWVVRSKERMRTILSADVPDDVRSRYRFVLHAQCRDLESSYRLNLVSTRWLDGSHS